MSGRTRLGGGTGSAMGATMGAAAALGAMLAMVPAAGAQQPAATTEAAPDAAMLARGKYLTDAGDCAACHTAPGGKPFAGGLYMSSPFGQITTPNITADAETGIGKWTGEDFYKSLHNGVRRDGQYIYPAMPYPWLTKVTREDVDAIHAYLLSVPPVHQAKPPSNGVFAIDVRGGMLAWNTLYFHAGTFKPDPSKSDQVNRGAYLVEGLAHCSDCHTPKNVAQAPIDSEAYSGGLLDGWYAPNITSDPKEGIGDWTEEELATYLKTGAAHGKGVVFGPMAQTVQESLSRLTDADIHAIAAYVKQIPAKATYRMAAAPQSGASPVGPVVYQNYCKSCHLDDGRGVAGKVPPLAGNGAVAAQGPQNVIRVIAGGLPANGEYAPMPGFAAVLSDQQIADVSNWVRRAWGNGAPENATADMVGSLTKRTRSMLAGTEPCTPLGQSAVDHAVTDPGGGIAGLLQSVDASNMLDKINAIVPKLRQADPAAPKADAVNSVTAAYCAVVTANPSLTPMQRYQQLTRFADLTYTQFTDHGQD